MILATVALLALLAAVVTVLTDMAMGSMLPSASFNSVGSATAGTVFGGPFEGPLTCQETGLTFLRVTKSVQIVDAVASLTSTGGALASAHAYLFSVGTVQNVIGVLYSADLAPGSAQRHAVALKIPANVDVIVRAVQIAGAAEASTVKIYWA